jgi:hypothetical protein
MANKFLGLDSINVLTSYIDQAVTKKTENSLVLTIQAYKYFANTDTIVEPQGGAFDFNFGEIHWPEGWNSLKEVLNNIENLSEALMDGGIYVSSAVIIGNSISWSRPMKISGQNGISVRFAYSYNPNATVEERTNKPSGVNVNNRVEYVWTKEAESDWSGPTIWSMYSQDADNVLWRYCVTNTLTTPEKPSVGNPNWSSNLVDRNLSREYPYMWMSSQIVPAGQDAHDGGWSEPILFGHWGMDGNVPDFNVTLYRIGENLDGEGNTPGLVKPAAPTMTENMALADFKTANANWKDLPEDDNNIWWQCTIKVNGQTGVVMEVGSVKRYNAVDGNARPGQFTMFVYRWSENQSQPQFNARELETNLTPKGWHTSYDYENDPTYEGDKISHLPDATLWMSNTIADGYDDNGYPQVRGWKNPVRITGPMGPISYDYRIETRYNIGTSAKPRALPTEEEWQVTPPPTNSSYPYVWAVNYLVCYKMKYDTANPNADGTYPIVEDGRPTLIDRNGDGYFRVSGLDGEDGNRKNSVNHTSEAASIFVTSFSSTNLYIANTGEGETVTYNIQLDQLAFINGYTGKFVNIGKGTMTLKTISDMKFTASGITLTEITLNPQESIELVCFNNDKTKQLLVIGKELTEPVTE